MLATRWRLLISHLAFSLPPLDRAPHFGVRCAQAGQPAYANALAAAARQRYQLQHHARLRRTGHRG